VGPPPEEGLVVANPHADEWIWALIGLVVFALGLGAVLGLVLLHAAYGAWWSLLVLVLGTLVVGRGMGILLRWVRGI
jgi:hypothetical protein